MKSHRFYISAFLMLVLSLSVQAKIWRVDSNTGNAADFRTLQAANDNGGVVDGDTLYVSGSPISYGNVTITKRLIIIGPGYFLSENDSTQALPNPATVGTVTFQSATSNGSTMMGLTTSYVYINGSNLTLRRNYFTTWVYIGYNNSVTNVILSQNYAYGFYLYNASNTNITISNNILWGYISATSNGSAIISQNVINAGNQSANGIESYNSVVDNNILYYGGISGTGNTYQNNMDSDLGGTNDFPASNGNVQDVPMNTVFVLTGSTDGKWKLKGGSPAIGAGTNGYDMGAFGGPSPYVLSGIPPIPAIYNVVAPVFGTGTQGLQVQVKAKSRN